MFTFMNKVCRVNRGSAYLRKSAVIPNVAMIVVYIVDESKFAIFDILSDRIEFFFFIYFHFGV